MLADIRARLRSRDRLRGARAANGGDPGGPRGEELSAFRVKKETLMGKRRSVYMWRCRRREELGSA